MKLVSCKLIPVMALVGSLMSANAFADDNEVKKSSDTSTNPITGTVTETQKEEVKKTNADGTVSKQTKKTKTKHKKDGSVEKSTEVDASKDVK